MFDIIAYISYPYSLDHKDTQSIAAKGLGTTLAAFYKRNPTWACVNPLYSFHNNPYAEKGSPLETPTPAVLKGLIEVLMKSATVHIVVRKPGWEYSDIVMAECACANKFGIPTHYEDV